MDCTKWNYSKGNTYLELCKRAYEDDNIFQKLKSNKDYSMVEKPVLNYKIVGEWLLNVYIKKYKKYLHLLEIGILNDQYLEPTKFNYEYILKDVISLSTYKLSYCCISYVIKALNIIHHISNLGINNLNIVEIGGGYGGQAYVLLKMSPNFDICIKSYTIFDLKYPSLIQTKYLNFVEIKNQYNINSYYNFDIDKDTISNFNFVISNYALSEISTDIQNEYFDKILYNVDHGFMLWNFLNNKPLNKKLSIDNYKNITFEKEECNPDKDKNSLEIKY